MKPKNVLHDSPKKAKNKVAFNHTWLEAFYSRVGREVSLAREGQRETHNWVITLMGGTVAAVWALGGSTFNYPTVSSFIVVLAITPLVFRFFVRSCLEYQIFNRWISLRNALDLYYFIKENKPDASALALQSLKEQIQIYYFQWKQPKTNLKMLWDNFLLAYGWPFILILIFLAWGIAMLPFTGLVRYASIITAAWMIFELINFVKYFAGRYKEPSNKIDTKEMLEV